MYPLYSGKSSTLLHIAYSLAASGKSALIICQKAKLEQQPPLLPEGVSSKDIAFSRVYIRYRCSHVLCNSLTGDALRCLGSPRSIRPLHG